MVHLIENIPAVKVAIASNEDEMADYAVREWVRMAQYSLKQKELFNVALSGGKTPSRFYRALASLREPRIWKGTHLFLVDERFLPLHHDESNFNLIYKNLLQHVKIASKNIHLIPTDKCDSETSAAAYDEEIKAFFNLREGEFPRFNLIMLGIGEDGHTASLFPGESLPIDEKRLVIATRAQGAPHERITLTLPVINNAARVIFLVSGANKSSIVKRIIGERPGPLPAQKVNPAAGDLLILLDEDAASQLNVKSAE